MQRRERWGTANVVEPSKLTVGGYLTRWLESIKPPVIRPGAWAAAELHVRTYLAPRIGDVPLQQLDRTTVKAVYVDIGENGRVRAASRRQGSSRPDARTPA